MDDIGKLGVKTQEKAGQTLKLLDRPVNDLMSGKRVEVPNMIMKLRNECENLQQSKNVSFFGKMLRKSPMKNYVYKYQSVRTNIDAIILRSTRRQRYPRREYCKYAPAETYLYGGDL